jgi:hypothetical protein
MNRSHESNTIDFDQVLREIQEENARRLEEIVSEPIPSIPFDYEGEKRRGFRFPSIIDIFIPSAGR